MPILWRSLLGNYIKVLILCVVSFIAILLVTRLDEIAQFAALGGQSYYLGLFALYQIPFILPIAIPISALISAMILFQKLSHSHELTAMRACGVSLWMISCPIILAGLAFSFFNFYITSELATESRLLSRKMIYEITSVNPIVLLQNAKIAKLKGAYVQMETVRNGELAKDVIIAINNHSNQRLGLLVTQEMEVKDQILKSTNVSFVSSLASNHHDEIDHLIVENQTFTEIQAPEFAHILGRSTCKVANDHLKLKFLFLRIKELKEKFIQSQQSASSQNSSYFQRHLTRCYSDVLRRISLGLAAFSFTFLGTAFGMEISRKSSKKGLVWVIALGAISLVSFFIAKEMDHRFLLSAVLYLMPHFLILSASLLTLKRISQGSE